MFRLTRSLNDVLEAAAVPLAAGLGFRRTLACMGQLGRETANGP